MNKHSNMRSNVSKSRSNNINSFVLVSLCKLSCVLSLISVLLARCCYCDTSSSFSTAAHQHYNNQIVSSLLVVQQQRRGACSSTKRFAAATTTGPLLVVQLLPRGGAEIDVDEEDEYEDVDEEAMLSTKNDSKNSDENNEEEEEDEYDEYEEADSDDNDNRSENSSTSSSSSSKEVIVYDKPLVVNPMSGMMVQIGVMLACRKLDMTDSKVITFARYSFIGYILLVNLFTLYVKVRSKSILNAHTVITLESPLMNMLKNKITNALGGDDTTNNNIQSMIAGGSRLLGTNNKKTITICEYDTKQANSVFFGLLPTLMIMWIMHFKFKQVQPIFITVATGLLTLLYSPLFQVYVLGKNLERPFTSPAAGPAQTLVVGEGDTTTSTKDEEIKEQSNEKRQTTQDASTTDDDDDDEDSSINITQEESYDTDDDGDGIDITIEVEDGDEDSEESE